MEAVSPQTGANEFAVAEEQEEYLPVPAALYSDPTGRLTLLSRWKFSDEERAAIARGEDLFLALITDGNPMQPLYIQIGANREDGVNWLMDSPGGGKFVCPICLDEFETMRGCVDHVRENHPR